MNLIKLRGLVLCICCMLLGSASYSQGNFYLGHVVTLEGDTLKGGIKYIGNRATTPSTIIYKSSWQADAVSYKPAEISSFQIEDRKFRSAYVEVEASPDGYNTLSGSSELMIRKNNLFLECIIDGDKNLYISKLKNGKAQFYFLDGGEFKLFYYKKYRKDGEVQSRKDFVEQLNNYFEMGISEGNYEVNYFEKIYKKYFQETGKEYSYMKSDRKLPGLEASSTLEQGSVFPNFQMGYIVLNDGDSVEGMIDYQSWDQNPKFIRFITSWLNDNINVYHPTQISAFGLADVHYRSAVVDTEISSQSVESLSRSAEFQLKQKEVFLKVLISGEKELLFYRDNLDLINFYISSQDSYRLLNYKKYLSLPNTDGDMRRDSNKAFMKENTKFKGQLNYYFSDCPETEKLLKRIQYTENSLINLYRAYYECKGENIVDQRQTTQELVESNALEENNKSTIIHKDKKNGSFQFQMAAGTAFSPEYTGAGLLAGAAIEVMPGRNQGRLSIYSELIYQTYKYETSVTRWDFDSNQHYTIVTEHKESIINTGAHLRYVLAVEGDVLPFIGFGLTTTRVDALRFAASFGLKIKKFNFEFRLDDADKMKKMQISYRLY